MSQHNDWIENISGEEPALIVPEGTVVEVEFRDGRKICCDHTTYDQLLWRKTGLSGDIMYYRVKLRNPPPPQEGEITLSAADVQATREWAKTFLAATDPAGADTLTVDDYKAVIDDSHRLTKELDVLLNGKGAAAQASLCDIVGQVGQVVRESFFGLPLLSLYPVMNRIANRKFRDLLNDGWTTAGYAIQKGDRFGMVTEGGRVLWWNEIMGERIGSAYGVHVDVQIETGSGTLALAQVLRDRILAIVDETEQQHGVPESATHIDQEAESNDFYEKAAAWRSDVLASVADIEKLQSDSDWVMSGPEALAALMEASYPRYLGHVHHAVISANGQTVYVNAFGHCAMTCIQLVQKVDAMLTGNLPVSLPEMNIKERREAIGLEIHKKLDSSVVDIEDLGHPKVSMIDVPEPVKEPVPLSTITYAGDTYISMTNWINNVGVFPAEANEQSLIRLDFRNNEAAPGEYFRYLQASALVWQRGLDSVNEILSYRIYAKANPIDASMINAALERGIDINDIDPTGEDTVSAESMGNMPVDIRPIPEGCPTSRHDDANEPHYVGDYHTADKSKPRLVGKTVFVWRERTQCWSVADDQLCIGIDSEGGSHD